MSAANLTADHLWARVRASFARALLVCGGPAAIAAITKLTHSSRTQMVRWLAPLENMVRKLLLVEAAAMAPAGPRTRPSTLSSNARTRCKVDADEHVRRPSDRTAPHTWAARFALAPPSDPHIVPDDRAARIRSLAPDPPWIAFTPPPALRVPLPRTRLDVAFRLARRFEALRRVLDDPLPHARRLARLIERLRPRHPEIAMCFAVAPPRTGGWDENDPRLGVSVTAGALSAAEVFPRDTS